MRIDDWNAARQSVETPDGSIAYVDIGTGPVALFVHGAFLTGALWRNVIEDLASDRRCIAIDLPAHGHTHIKPGVDVSPRAHAEIFDDFCRVLDLETVDLVGNDTGGAMCQLFAAHHPARIRTLVLTNCETPDALEHENFMPPEFSEPARKGELAPRLAYVLDHPEIARSGKGIGIGYARPEEALTDEVVRAYLHPTFSTPERGAEFERYLVGLRSQDLRDAAPLLQQLTAPTMLVWGTDDPLFELEAARRLQQTMLAALPVREVEGAKVFFPAERADDLARLLREFWALYPHTSATLPGDEAVANPMPHVAEHPIADKEPMRHSQ